MKGSNGLRVAGSRQEECDRLGAYDRNRSGGREEGIDKGDMRLKGDGRKW